MRERLLDQERDCWVEREIGWGERETGWGERERDWLV